MQEQCPPGVPREVWKDLTQRSEAIFLPKQDSQGPADQTLALWTSLYRLIQDSREPDTSKDEGSISTAPAEAALPTLASWLAQMSSASDPAQQLDLVAFFRPADCSEQSWDDRYIFGVHDF